MTASEDALKVPVWVTLATKIKPAEWYELIDRQSTASSGRAAKVFV